MHFRGVGAQDDDFAGYELAGWAWTDTYGWISLNGKNPSIEEELLAVNKDYKVEISSTGDITGWAWSENVGWLCFGSTCSSIICAGNPSGGWNASLNTTDRSITGWAMVVSMCEDGWIKLGMGPDSAIQPNDEFVHCYSCYKELIETEEEAEEEEEPEYERKCKTCFTRTNFDRINVPDPDIPSVVGGSGKICFDCYDNCDFVSSGDSKIYRYRCDSCDRCFTYGMASGDNIAEDEDDPSQSSTYGELVGWAWNAVNDQYIDGTGWINISGKAGIVLPWLETIYGSIYTRGIIRQQGYFPSINATYCLLAQSVFQFSSSQCLEKNYSDYKFDFPQTEVSELGRLDLVGLSTVAKEIDGTDYNKYGNIIVSSSESSISDSIVLGNVLDNRVFVYNDDLAIDGRFDINNGAVGEKGNGLIIVNGDLTINSDFDYTSASDVPLEQLASVAWVVKGDVIVAPNVEKIVGAFIVLGEDGITCQYDDGGGECDDEEYPKYETNGYGIFFSGESSKPLTVSGPILAKAFDFRRIYSSLLQGSERIIYDGRLLANPPPGLKGFLENLPLLRE
jgi:hypothetical protein